METEQDLKEVKESAYLVWLPRGNVLKGTGPYARASLA